MNRNFLLAATLAASLGAFATPAAADIVVRVGPPPPRAELVPQPRRGHVWVAGHWNWKGNQHHWVTGKWVRERRGHYYNQPAWAERNGHWYMERGGWIRGDRDGDGVPNRFDRAPGNPNRS